MIYIFNILIFIYIAFILGCKSYWPPEQRFNGERIDANTYSISKFNYNDELNKIINIENLDRPYFKSDSVYFIYNITNYYYYFAFNSDIRKYENYSNECIFDGLGQERKLLVIDTLNKKIYYHDSINISDECGRLTKNYIYFYVNVKGAYKISNDEYLDYFYKNVKEYIDGLIILNKQKPLELKYYLYKNETVVFCDQSRDFLKVITTKLKIKIAPWARVVNKYIWNEFEIGYFVSTGKYYEYLYDLNLKLVSKKEVAVPDIE